MLECRRRRAMRPLALKEALVCSGHQRPFSDINDPNFSSNLPDAKNSILQLSHVNCRRSNSSICQSILTARAEFKHILLGSVCNCFCLKKKHFWRCNEKVISSKS
ncbi:unnamed protein product [Cuscuta epithymum]|uniref:Uncharacterized protein n=1 Tax=Cuscuta epithymum TaxID=186058 RepID=A0AAV0E6H4_9ASTE|nr:unnamed protein product [Cuscuta epithymum]CAH9118919.1 unnamed protein product [Cuscuta epithymum]